MTGAEAVAALVAACREAGADVPTIFAHFDDADVQAYADALASWLSLDQLHLWMRSTAATIAEGRCLCRACIAQRKAAA